MAFPTGFRRPKSTDVCEAWRARLEATYLAEHPRIPGRYDTYLHFVAFLTAGSIEQCWTQGARAGGRAPFVPQGRSDDFLSGLHKQMRAFRESRHINGPDSAELTGHSYRLLNFMETHVPSNELERFLAIARAYIIQNANECLLA